MKIYTGVFFSVLAGFLLSKGASGIRPGPVQTPNTITVIMADGSEYDGHVVFRPNVAGPPAPGSVRPPQRPITRYAYFMRLEDRLTYAAGLTECLGNPPHDPESHYPQECTLKLRVENEPHYRIYSANRFEPYPGNDPNLQGDLGRSPQDNHIYVAVPNKGLYRSVLERE